MTRSITSLAVAAAAAASLTAGLIAPAAATELPSARTVASSTTTAGASSLLDDPDFRAAFERALAEAPIAEADRAQISAALQDPAAFDALYAESMSTLATLQADLAAAGYVSEYGDLINPDDYVCGSTPLRAWAAQWQPVGLSPAEQGWYDSLAPFLAAVPTYYALLRTPEDPRSYSFGPDGTATNTLTQTWRHLNKFWDIDGSQIGLVPLDGDILTPEFQEERVAMWESLGGGFLFVLGESAIEVVLPMMPRGADNPLLSLNAFAIDPSDEPDLEAIGVTKRVAMGSGILEAVEDLGLGTAGQRAILAHEYGHQVQMAQGLFDVEVPKSEVPAATRRTELMADALATYELVHARGAALNAARTLQDAQTFYNVGDCGFDSDGHHGTPNQRFRASTWAADLVKSAPNRGKILPSMTFIDLFDAQLPVLVAPDAR